MGREIKRVALDFDWPLKKVWKGYINPHYKPCPEDQKTCFNGITGGAQWLDAVCRFICMLADDVRQGLPAQSKDMIVPHPYIRDFPTAPIYSVPREKAKEFADLDQRERMTAYARYLQSIPEDNRVIRPTNDLLDVINKIMDQDEVFRTSRENKYFSGYSNNSYGMYFAFLKMAGVDAKTWGRCPVCNGETLDPAVKEAYDAWKPEEPPAGPGYQLWETVSEGSPISPVFPTKEKFADYLVGAGYTRKAAENFIESEWAPSMVVMVGSGKTYKDIESCDMEEK